MTNFEIARDRLYHQRISAAPLNAASEVVDWLCAVQAQDYAGAKWALALRMQSATDSDLDRAFAAGDILRTHLMRPTWHFVTPADIRWMLTLTAPRVHVANAFMYRKLELDNATLQRNNAVLADTLQGGRQLTRDELRDALQNAGLAPGDGLRLSYLMMSAELDGVICSGARRGKQFTYALIDERAPQAKMLEREEALVELSRRYFISRGPATVQDFAKWSGLTIADCQRGLNAVKGQLEERIIAGQSYWGRPSPPDQQQVSPSAYLLSIYDEYISSYKDSSAIGEAEVGAKLMALGNALTYIMVVDGQIVGNWRRTLSQDAVTIETNPFWPLTPAEDQAVAEAARRYGAFLELPVVFR